MGMRMREGQQARKHHDHLGDGQQLRAGVSSTSGKKEVFSHGISHTWIVSCCIRCRVAL
jgi:hypothetical protein